MSVTKVMRSKSARGAVIYAVWGKRSEMQLDHRRAEVLSVVGASDDPVQWFRDASQQVRAHSNRKNELIIIIQSFPPEELDKAHAGDLEKAHSCGLELAQRLAPDCDVLVATHTDKPHLHNHIYIVNHDRASGKAAPKKAGNHNAVKHTNDKIMRDYGLRVQTPDPRSLSRAEMRAQADGRSIDSTGLSVGDLTSDTWRDYLCRRIEELMDDERVLAAPSVDASLDAMEQLAHGYGIGFSRKGSSGARQRERSSFALVDSDGEPLRIPRLTSRGLTGGTVEAVVAGSRLGADYTMRRLREELEERRENQRRKQKIDQLRRAQNGSKQAAAGAAGTVQNQLQRGARSGDRTQGQEGGAIRANREATAGLASSVRRLEQGARSLEDFNRRQRGVSVRAAASSGRSVVDRLAYEQGAPTDAQEYERTAYQRDREASERASGSKHASDRLRRYAGLESDSKRRLHQSPHELVEELYEQADRCNDQEEPGLEL